MKNLGSRCCMLLAVWRGFKQRAEHFKVCFCSTNNTKRQLNKHWTGPVSPSSLTMYGAAFATAAWPVGETLNPNRSFDVGIRNEEAAACLWHSQKKTACLQKLIGNKKKILLPKRCRYINFYFWFELKKKLSFYLDKLTFNKIQPL